MNTRYLCRLSCVAFCLVFCYLCSCEEVVWHEYKQDNNIPVIISNSCHYKEGKLYIYGGYGISGVPSMKYKYNNLWIGSIDANNKQVNIINTLFPSSMPEYRLKPCITWDNRQMYLYGGDVVDGNSHIMMSDMWVLNLDNKTWSKIDPPKKGPGPMRGAYSFIVNLNKSKYIYYILGEYMMPDQGGLYTRRDICRYNILSNEWDNIEWRSDWPSIWDILFDITATIQVENKLYFFGRNQKGDKTNCLLIYNIIEDKWSTVNPQEIAPERRRSYSYAYCNSNMYIYGGYRGGEISGREDDYLGDMWIYRIPENKWNLNKQQNDKGPGSRMLSAMLCDENGNVFIIGGLSFNKIYHGDIWAFKF